ncbi:MAG: hypothetical protein AB1630_12330, partial [bacterium]
RKLDLLDLGVDPSIVKDDAKLYKTTLYPKKSILGGILGIRSGTVIAYGHLLKPPYYVERKDEEVFINGIRVHPILSNPNYKITVVVTEEERKRYKEKREIEGKIGKALKEYYLEVKAKEGREVAKKKLLEFAKRFEDIEKIEWDNDMPESPFIKWKHEKYPTAIDNFAYPNPTEEERKKAKERRKKDSLETAIKYKKRYEEDLKANGVWVFNYGGTPQTYQTYSYSNIKESVINIMENLKLSNKEKIKELMLLFWKDDDAGKSVFYNYDPKEWKE